MVRGDFLVNIDMVLDYTHLIAVVLGSIITGAGFWLRHRYYDKKRLKYSIAEFYAKLSLGRIDDRLKENMLKELRANGLIQEARDIEEKLRGGFSRDIAPARAAMDDILAKLS